MLSRRRLGAFETRQGDESLSRPALPPNPQRRLGPATIEVLWQRAAGLFIESSCRRAGLGTLAEAMGVEVTGARIGFSDFLSNDLFPELRRYRSDWSGEAISGTIGKARTPERRVAARVALPQTASAASPAPTATAARDSQEAREAVARRTSTRPVLEWLELKDRTLFVRVRARVAGLLKVRMVVLRKRLPVGTVRIARPSRWRSRGECPRGSGPVAT